MISSYATIDKLFGTPLSGVPQPNVPFKLKGWHIAAGIALGLFAAYGVYCAQRDVLKYFKEQYIEKKQLR